MRLITNNVTNTNTTDVFYKTSVDVHSGLATGRFWICFRHVMLEMLLPQPNKSNNCVLLRITTNTIAVFYKTIVYVHSGFKTATFWIRFRHAIHYARNAITTAKWK